MIKVKILMDNNKEYEFINSEENKTIRELEDEIADGGFFRINCKENKEQVINTHKIESMILEYITK